jgi:hypothetical protein
MKLPKKVLIPKDVLKDKSYDAIADYLSDKFEFCVNSFVLRKNYAIKIDWDTSD